MVDRIYHRSQFNLVTHLKFIIMATTSTTKVGVISSILDIIKKSGKNGVTKDQILEQLVVLFPNRNKVGMSKTIQMQLPKRMSAEKKVNIVKSDKGTFSIG
jgi:hypothetical protein